VPGKLANLHPGAQGFQFAQGKTRQPFQFP